jgi:hypothetical protein
MKLADEIAVRYCGEGEAIKKRDDVHKMAEANKASRTSPTKSGSASVGFHVSR